MAHLLVLLLGLSASALAVAQVQPPAVPAPPAEEPAQPVATASMFMPEPLNMTALDDGAPTECPPPGFDSVERFNLREYIAAPWYVQRQVSAAARGC